MMKLLLSTVLLLSLVLVACTTPQSPTGGITTDVIFENTTTPVDTGGNETNATNPSGSGATDAEKEAKANYNITVTEGDLVQINPKAVSPDGNKITFTFSKPLNKNGKWQTKEGDAGKFLATITADDGTSQTSQDVLIIVKPANKAPTIECPQQLKVKETEDVFIDCNIFDVDGPDSEIKVTYSGWMTQAQYKTTYNDAGEHTVVVTAEDIYGKKASAEVKVIVENVDRAPVFDKDLKDIKAMEGDMMVVTPEVSDPDNDKLNITYSPPFDATGKWQTKIGDAGTYNAWVAVSDGQLTTKQDFKVVVQLVNTAPVIKPIPDIHVDEGDLVKIKVDATDREGDPLKITYSGWMTSAERQTTYDDARPNGCSEPKCTAKYSVLVVVSDGALQTNQTVNIYVTDVPRPPVFTGFLTQ
jgi:hypothetical protein